MSDRKYGGGITKIGVECWVGKATTVRIVIHTVGFSIVVASLGY